MQPLKVPASIYVLRRRLGNERIVLRELNDRMPLAKARAEVAAIAQAGGDEKALGGNAEARARGLTLALWTDHEYCRFYQHRQEVEREVADLEAEIEALVDQRRAEEWAIRERLVDALTSRGLDAPGNGGTGSTEVATDEVTYRAMRQAQAKQDVDELWP